MRWIPYIYLNYFFGIILYIQHFLPFDFPVRISFDISKQIGFNNIWLSLSCLSEFYLDRTNKLEHNRVNIMHIIWRNNSKLANISIGIQTMQSWNRNKSNFKEQIQPPTMCRTDEYAHQATKAIHRPQFWDNCYSSMWSRHKRTQ